MGLKFKEFVRKTLLILILAWAFAFSCKNGESSKAEVSTLDKIREKGKLVAVTSYNAVNYFIYRGEPMGFQFELLKEFAGQLGTRLEVVVTNNLEKDFESLEKGECDIIAQNLAITSERKEKVDFTTPFAQTRQVLVQRKGDNDKPALPLVKTLLDLDGKTVYVQRNSAYSARLKNLSQELGITLRIVEVPEEAEELIQLVSEGEINYTVCDENVGLVDQGFYANIDMQTPVSFQQNVAWAVNKGSGQLLKEINTWMENFKKTAKYAVIYDKYFNGQNTGSLAQSDYSMHRGRVSKYDETIRKYSKEIGWDWRLLASLIAQESRFVPTVKSWAGAYGLMQLMPTVSRRFGVDSISTPEANIKAGVKLIKLLDREMSQLVVNKEERVKFILASYNIGLGHILDARKLAIKNGKNPAIWSNNVEFFLKNKSEAKYYKDPVVQFGYCHGEKACTFVQEVLERYQHYKNLAKR
jgi:membrane-bound lytic murein transglycosylase F